MKSIFIFSLLIFLLGLTGVDIRLRPMEAGAKGEIARQNGGEKLGDVIILRDPFLDPEWLKKKRAEEEKRKAEKKRRREAETKKRALKLKGIVQVGQNFVAIVNDKTLREGEVIRGRKVLEVNRWGIKVLYRGKVRKIFWEPKTISRRSK